MVLPQLLGNAAMGIGLLRKSKPWPTGAAQGRADVKRATDKIHNAGNQMSNVCYNLAQCEGIVLTRRHCESMRLAQLEWDAAVENHAITRAQAKRGRETK